MLRVVKGWLALLIMAASFAATAAGETHWVTSWAASVHGPYPVGNPSAQPNLSLVFPAAETGARDQSFRLIVKPEFWGARTRLRFSNALGTQPVTFDGAYAGLQWSGSAVMPGTNRAITFGGKRSVTVAPGESVWSDAVALPFVKKGNAEVDAVIAGMREGVARIRGRIPGVKVIGATLTSAHGFELQDEKRKKLNEFIRTSGVFDGVADFDRATTDPQTGGMQAAFIPDNTVGGPGDKLHPNRMGYQAMGMAIDLEIFGLRAGAPKGR